MNTESITLYPELFEDLALYILVAVLICLAAKFVYDWKENRRLQKEMAAYQQMKEDDRESK